MSTEELRFPEHQRQILEPFLPRRHPASNQKDSVPPRRPHVTLTYAMSLDAMIAAAPGVQTILSGPESKAMTHYLRTRHDAILVGAGTAVADNPTLNSRLAGTTVDFQPRPIIVDRQCRWSPRKDLKVIQAARAEKGKAPWIFRGSQDHANSRESRSNNNDNTCNQEDVRYLISDDKSCQWPFVLGQLARENIHSVMIEGGASVIRTLLRDYSDCIDSLIITVAPTYLGAAGLHASPYLQFPPGESSGSSSSIRLSNVQWLTLGNDAVVCGNLPKR